MLGRPVEVLLRDGERRQVRAPLEWQPMAKLAEAAERAGADTAYSAEEAAGAIEELAKAGEQSQRRWRADAAGRGLLGP